MKKIITFSLVIIFIQLSNFNCYSQSPNAIPYQGVARNASGAILGSQPISLRFSLHDATAVGAVVYQETHATSTNALGLFTLNIGNGTPSIGTMASIDWANGAKFIQVEMDATGGTTYIDMGTTQMLSVPFALYAKIAGATPGAVIYKGTWDAITNTPHLSSGVGVQGDMYIVSNASSVPSSNTNLDGITKYNIGDTVIYNGFIYQALSTSTSPIRAADVDLDANPDMVSTNVQDAIEEVSTITDSKLAAKLNLSGGTMTGNLILDSPPISDLQAATKKYVDDSLSPVQTQFTSLIDSMINKLDDGITIIEDVSYSTKRIGINELVPDTVLHVSRPLSDSASDISLQPGTGIVVIGPVENNLVMDYRGIQARQGEFVAPGSSLQVAGLNLQRLGGDVLLHGDASLALSQKAIITTDAKLGLGTLTPTEKIDIDGAIKIGTTSSNNDGTIRYTGTDFEGSKAGSWVSLTNVSPWEKVDNSSNKIRYNTTDAKVAIGTDTPTSSLHVFNNENTLSSTNTVFIDTQSSTSSTSSNFTRAGLEISCSGTWSSNSDAKNIGLYVSDVAGQSSQESNIAAVLNGNVVIGSVSSAKAVGVNGTNVLAIQTGTSAPETTTQSSTAGGIQIYSDNLSPDSGLPPVSVAHIMNGNGDVIKLFKQSAIAPVNMDVPSSGNPATDAIINNLRTRLNELEARLQNIGLLKPPTP